MAESRLNDRSHRPGVENCDDDPHKTLVDEIAKLNISEMLLQEKIEEAENSR